MPNGVGKNWVRMCAAIDGFRVRYRSWPRQVRMSVRQIDDIKSVFKPETFKRLESRINLVAGANASVVAEDERGRAYDYGKAGFPRKKPRPDAASWLGVEPDIPLWDIKVVFVEEEPIKRLAADKSSLWKTRSDFSLPVPEEEKYLYETCDPNSGYPQYPVRKGRNKSGEFPVVVVRKYFMDKGYNVWVSGQSKLGIPVFNLFMFPGARKRRDPSYLIMVDVFGEEIIRNFIATVELKKNAKGLRRNGGDPDLFVQNPQNPNERFFVEVKAEDLTRKRPYRDKLNEQQLLVFPLIENHLQCDVRIAKVQILPESERSGNVTHNTFLR